LKADGAAIKAAGFDAIVARCTIGWSYLDPWYINNLREAEANGLAFGAYHVLWPSNQNPTREAKWFAEQIDGRGNEKSPDFIVADLELTQGLSANNVGDQIKTLLPAMESEIGLKPIVYTGSWWWNGTAHLGPATPLGIEPNYDLWEAEYLKHPTGELWSPNQAPQAPKEAKTLGRGWDKWLFWQWTAHGEPIGVQSRQMDYNVFNGTEEDFRKFLGDGSLTDKEKLDLLWEAHPELHPEA
jgi:GH25 family lysozyme M1 (1,4-beta-N-acetylmuramidase)